MKILFASSEVYPLVKTGGLADVSGSLPQSLKRLRNDVRIILPAYPEAMENIGHTKVVAEFGVLGCPEPVKLIEGELGETKVKVYLLDSPTFFNRPGKPYTTPDGVDWMDNAARFTAFSRAVAMVALDKVGLHWKPSIVHANDWQTGLVPAFLSLDPERPATIFTIHNLAYQGNYSYETFQYLNLPQDWWSMHGCEFHGQVSFLKSGIVFSDWVTTVSPTYAREIRTSEYGFGMEGLLQSRGDRLVGILNGANYEEWNPIRDPHLESNYSIRKLSHKIRNKAGLQLEMGLPQDREPPMLAYVGRLAHQKGIDMILDSIPQMMDQAVQLVILGSGDPAYESAINEAQRQYPDQIAVYIGYNEALAHRIEAAADIFLMPSRYEPCGLNQIYSLRYGTVPVVRRTGGLADTVVDATARTNMNGTATGFVFDDATSDSFMHAVHRALTFYHRPPVWWKKLVVAGMEEDFSWTISAKEYLGLYKEAVAEREA